MKLWIVSDLHIDVHPYHVPEKPVGARVCIVAGDVGGRLCRDVLPWLSEQMANRGVALIYVPGNHCFHGVNIALETARARSRAAELGIVLLDGGQSLIIGGVRFCGATLWTDYAVTGEPTGARQQALHSMSDHKKIQAGSDRPYGRFTPREAAALHEAHLETVTGVLATPHPGPTVVITHHAPSPRSLQHSRPTQLIDGAYASDLEDFIRRYRPALWVHGHTHRRLDYHVESTRVVANPRGYVIQDHDPQLTVDVCAQIQP